MELSFPIHVELLKPEGQAPIYHAKLLFFPWISSSDPMLQRATNRLLSRTKKEFDRIGRMWSHRELFHCAVNPNLTTHRVKLSLDLKNRWVKVKYMLVVIEAFDRKIVFNPKLDNLWFEVTPDQDLQARANEVYQKFFRQQLSQLDEEAAAPEQFSIKREAWVTTIEADIRVDQESDGESLKKFMALWSEEKMDGATELYRVGRCLDQLYPDDLDIAIQRNEEIEVVEKLLNSEDHRPVLILGESLVGKTAILHQVVRQRVEERKKSNSSQGNVWLLSPQRLISGMSYVGQWENRFLAIVEEAKKKNLILYFDDLPGLFLAGKTSKSSLSVADLLKNELLKSGLRVVAEITPAAYDKLIDRDRSFADLFQIIRVEPTDEQATMNIAIQYSMEQESRQKCRFDISAIPKVIQLQRQYNRLASFPGKAAKFLKELAVKHAERYVDHRLVLLDFAISNGISNSFLDDRVTQKREDVITELQNSVIGQLRAVEACADVIGWTKAKLNAPNKPLATMLFLGPTGVGKTEMAKTLAQYMFRSIDQMIRFDLNEFKSPYSVARLIGTMDEPEGLLTSAVRRNPFSVILLDEIEKAHPDVFDVLLQVTGEGRLTDSIGRTSDFSNCVLIMTSNLGSSANAHSLGFSDEQAVNDQQQHKFIRAAQKFFRPEFFNRIDKIIPFDPLTRKEIESIAEQMMQKVVSREGLLRRRCILQVDKQALNHVATRGYHPKMGARALKRAIENDFTQPVASELSAIRNDVPTVIQVRGTGSEADDAGSRYDLKVNPLENVTPVDHRFSGIPIGEIIRSVEGFLERFETEHLSIRPAGEISGSGISPELLRYLSLAEQVSQVRELVKEIKNDMRERSETLAPPEIHSQQPRMKRSKSVTKGRVSDDGLTAFLKGINSVADIGDFVNESVKQRETQMKLENPIVHRLIEECCLLESMQRSHDRPFFFFVRSFQGLRERGLIRQLHRFLISAYQSLFGDHLSMKTWVETVEISSNEAVTLYQLHGSSVSDFVQQEAGSQLYCDETGKLSLFQSGYFELETPDYFGRDGERTGEFLKSEKVLSRLAANASFEVIRMYDFERRTIDLRSGIVDRSLLTGDILKKMISAGLALPRELVELQEQAEEKIPDSFEGEDK